MAKRLFVAIDLPAAIAGELAGLDPHVAGLRWLPASQLHLTLSFLGEVPEENEQALIRALGEIAGQPFPLSLMGFGAFRRHGRISVVWAGLEGEPPELCRLQAEVNAAVLAAGLEGNGKRFHGHVTVGRCKGLPAWALQPFLREHATTGFGSFEVRDFILYHSILRPEGAEHLPVFRRDFGGT